MSHAQYTWSSFYVTLGAFKKVGLLGVVLSFLFPMYLIKLRSSSVVNIDNLQNMGRERDKKNEKFKIVLLCFAIS